MEMETPMNRVAIFAFSGDPMCFSHVLNNALDMHDCAFDVKIVLEGAATRMIREMQESGNPLFARVMEEGLIDGACKACSASMGVLEYNERSGVPLIDAMNGHPSMGAYIEMGYQIITL